jgi:hypothetical protein
MAAKHFWATLSCLCWSFKLKRLLALSSLLFFAVAFAADKASVDDLLKNPAKFDNKAVTVTGKVDHFKAKTSKAGRKYFTFDLVGSGNYRGLRPQIAVYGQVELKPLPKNGDKVEATGLFAKERHVGSSVYKNELDVTSKGKDKNGVKVVKYVLLPFHPLFFVILSLRRISRPLLVFSWAAGEILGSSVACQA